MDRGIFYCFYRGIQHYFLLNEKDKRAREGDSPNIRRLYNGMHSPLPQDALPIATEFGELMARISEPEVYAHSRLINQGRIPSIFLRNVTSND